MVKSQARLEYERVYRNAKAKERRLKNTHNVTVDFQMHTPSEWENRPNKKREITKLENFTNRGNSRYDYINLGKESIKRHEYQEITRDSKKINDAINYHKKKNLKAVMDLPYLVTLQDGTTLQTDQRIEERIAQNHKQMIGWQKDSSIEQGTKKRLKQYQAKQKRQLKNLKNNTYAEISRKNYINKLDDFKLMFKGSPYESEYRDFMKTMKGLSVDDYEKFYYLSNMGEINKVKYIDPNLLGTPEGQEVIYANMKQIQNAWESVSKLISS